MRTLGSVPLDHAVITDARLVPEGPGDASPTPGGAPPPVLPAHCRVQLDLKPAADSLIKMEVWLPPAAQWNGKFLGAGNGGFAGSIQGTRSGMPEALKSGYATAGTDTGHQEPGGKWAIGHPDKVIDFAYRSTHEMTLKAKQLVQAFYDKPPQRSYFSSCSTGGRMAVMEAQRYPEDYDGIVAGALANRHIRMWAAGIASSVELLKHPEGALSKEQAALVNDLVTRKCDVLKEGFLNDPRQCAVDFTALRCAAGQSGSACLTEPQLKTVATFYAGMKNSKGELVFSGAPLSRSINASSTNTDGPNGLFDLVRIARNDATLDWKTFDVDRDVKLLDEKLGFVDAINPDLTKFKGPRRQAAAVPRLGRPQHHGAEHDPVLRIRSRQDGSGAGRLGAAVHRARDGPLPRGSGPQWFRFDPRHRAVGRAGCDTGAARGPRVRMA